MGKHWLAKLLVAAGLCLVLLAQVAVAHAQVQGQGSAAISDSGAASNKFTIAMTGVALPPEGTGYTASLANAAGTSVLNLGRLSVDANGNVSQSFTTSENLIANYSRLWVSFGPPDIRVYEGVIPAATMLHIRHLLVAGLADDPLQKGYVNGMVSEATVALQHANLSEARGAAGDLAGVKQHAEHVTNIIDGTTVDYDGDGTGLNPGDGVGLLTYASSAATHAQLSGAAGATDVVAAANNVTAWAQEAKANAQRALQQTNVSLAQLYAQKARSALDSALNGGGAGKAGATQAYTSAQRLATYVIAPAEIGALPSVGDTAVPVLPLASLVTGIVLLSLGGVLLVRRRTQER